jgi:1,4-alpha-glucan branching enzyme
MVIGLASSQVSNHDGMGNIVFPGGTAFRVWAPFASQVQVAFYNDLNQDNNSPLLCQVSLRE